MSYQRSVMAMTDDLIGGFSPIRTCTVIKTLPRNYDLLMVHIAYNSVSISYSKAKSVASTF